MRKNVIIAGLLGGLVLIVWTFVVNGLLGFQANIDMNQLPAEREVYEVLRTHVVEPGRYALNPELTEGERFPDNEPVFSVLYSGMGHESAGKLMLVGLGVFFLAPLIAAWMLSLGSEKLLSSYLQKVLFFAAIGLLFALSGDLMNFGIGGYAAKDTALLALNHIVAWILVGLVVARRILPARS